MRITAEQIVAAAFTARREPEYQVSEPEDFEDAEVAVEALRAAGMLRVESAVVPNGAPGPSKENWLEAFEDLLLGTGTAEKVVDQVMYETVAVFIRAEREFAAQELDSMARLTALSGRVRGVDSKIAGFFADPLVKRADVLRSRSRDNE